MYQYIKKLAQHKYLENSKKKFALNKYGYIV